ncbi:MAG: glycosyltransferase family 2 protein [Deltaproteobacteria bacterium]|jgi:glycosyltransferase involved in cell wall biosynthesis|nr:glycosyltransferase family 2 protein [Deltaproteobacteria bacterium]
MSNNLLTIAMPVYYGGKNNGSYLERCLKSLLNQTFSDFKVVIIDNCSQDSTKEIVFNTVKNDKRFEYYVNDKNYGLKYSLNRSLELCTSKYYSELHFDSYWAPEYAEKCISALEMDSKCVIAYSYCQFIDEDDNKIDIFYDKKTFDDDDVIKRYPTLLSELKFCTPLHGISRFDNALKNYKKSLPSNNAAFDFQFLALMALDGKLKQVTEPLFYRLKDRYQRIKTTLPFKIKNFMLKYFNIIIGQNFWIDEVYNRLFNDNLDHDNKFHTPYCNLVKDIYNDLIESNLEIHQKICLLNKAVDICNDRFRLHINYDLMYFIQQINNYIETNEFTNDKNNMIIDKYDKLSMDNLNKELIFASFLRPNSTKIKYLVSKLNNIK